jgi:thioredoxin:protein disulfide reductase
MKSKQLLLLMLFSTTVFAQFGMNQKVLDVQVVADQDKIVRSQDFKIAVILNIVAGMHINSNKPAGEFFIPTAITFMPTAGMSFGIPQFPVPVFKTFSFSDEKLSIFEGKTVVVVSISTSPDLDLAMQTIKGQVSYQGCNDTMCFAPEEKSFELSLDVVEAGASVRKMNQELFQREGIEKTVTAELSADERAALGYLEKGILTAILAFFVIGLALNLTPCVYPIIPLTVSYFGGQSNKSRASTFVNSLFYLLGIALAFAALGLLSGLAGKQWGFLFTSPWFVVVIASIILLMAASLFGAFEISVPSWLLTRVSKTKEGTIGAFIMGLTAGVIIAPCAAGIIIGLVGLIAKFGLVFKGTLLFFFMGLGLGLPYLVLAMFSGLIGKLPQSGGWMLWIKKVFAFMLIGVAIYFILPQLEQVVGKLGFLFGITAVTAGLLLGFFEHGMYSKGFNIIRRIIGVLFILFGLYSINGAIHAKKSEILWTHYVDQTVETLVADGKPIFIDFYADWCAPCKQLDRITFTDPNVTRTAESFTMLKVDCTSPDAAAKQLMERFKVSGMPTLIFISKSGIVQENLREIGFVAADRFLASMEKTIAVEGLAMP